MSRDNTVQLTVWATKGTGFECRQRQCIFMVCKVSIRRLWPTHTLNSTVNGAALCAVNVNDEWGCTSTLPYAIMEFTGKSSLFSSSYRRWTQWNLKFSVRDTNGETMYILDQLYWIMDHISWIYKTVLSFIEWFHVSFLPQMVINSYHLGYDKSLYNKYTYYKVPLYGRRVPGALCRIEIFIFPLTLP